MKPLVTGICEFEALRKAGKTYVDKTAWFHRLVTRLNFDSKTRQLVGCAEGKPV